MKRFILAASMFSTWLAIASTYYMSVIKGVCSSNEEPVTTTEIKTTPIPIKKIIPKTTKIETHITDTLCISTIEKENTLDSLKISRLKIYDKDYLLKGYYGNFKIYKDSDRVQIPFGISEYGYVLAKHMDSTNTALNIKGYYNQEETESVGLQRANFIKKRLTTLGVPETLVKTSSQLAIYNYEYNKFAGGIQFNFKKLDSIITLNKIDYSLLQNNQKNDPVITEEKIISAVEKPIIKEVPVKEEPTPVATATEVKKEKATENKKESILFTVTQKDFKNKKFKPSRAFKKFLEKHESTTSIKLMGYSNANETLEGNFNKGKELANLVNVYLKEKGDFTGKVTIAALKKQSSATENNIREGVTLIIQ